MTAEKHLAQLDDAAWNRIGGEAARAVGAFGQTPAGSPVAWAASIWRPAVNQHVSGESVILTVELETFDLGIDEDRALYEEYAYPVFVDAFPDRVVSGIDSEQARTLSSFATRAIPKSVRLARREEAVKALDISAFEEAVYRQLARELSANRNEAASDEAIADTRNRFAVESGLTVALDPVRFPTGALTFGGAAERWADGWASISRLRASA